MDIIVESSVAGIVSWATAKPIASSDGTVATMAAAMMWRVKRTIGTPGNVVQASLAHTCFVEGRLRG